MKIGNKKIGGLFRTIFVASMFCMLVPVLIVSFISINNFSKNLTDTARQNLHQLSIEKMNEVGSMIDNQVQLTKAVAESSYIQIGKFKV